MYDWICTDELPGLPADARVALFGAGQGSVDYLALHAQRGGPVVVAVADNDPSMWGKTLRGVPIIPPDAIGGHAPDAVIVTTVSGRDAVGGQLAAMGYVEGVTLFKVGVFPSATVHKVRTMHAALASLGGLRPGQRVLHVGPGGFLGLECCLHALGLEAVSTDAYAFAMAYPDIAKFAARYAAQRAPLLVFAAEIGRDPAVVAARWDALFTHEDGRILLDTGAIPYRAPHRFGCLPFDDAFFDLVMSLEVLEHVRRPAMAVAESWRVLRPGGVAVGQITTWDHRAFGQVEGYTPLSYLNYSEEAWDRLNENKFYQNRVLPHMWRRLFEEAGFVLPTWRVTGRYEPSASERAGYHPDFRNIPLAQLADMNCVFAAQKPA
ncbi:MAG: methyltransferase domain-containing protein [Desulfovibrionaceae bacterium]